MNKEFYKTQTSIGAAFAIIGFVLPWVSLGPFSISGYEIPKVAEMFSGIGRSFSNGELSMGTQLYYILYFIPLLSGYLIYAEYKGGKKYITQAKFIISLLTAIVLFKLSTFDEVNIFEVAGLGLYLTFGGSVYLLIQVINEFDWYPTGPVVESEIIPAESGTTNKINLDNAGYQAKSREFLKLNPKIIYISIASTAMVILSVGLYFLLHKNSYQKVMSALENNQWEEVNYNYEKSLVEITSGDLILDYDETKRLEIAHTIANNMIPRDEFRKKYYSIDKSDIGAYYDLVHESVKLPDLKTKPLHAGSLGIDVDKINEPYIVFSDSFNLAFIELYFTESLMQKFQTFELNQANGAMQLLNEETDLIFSRIIDPQNKDVQLRVERVKNKLAEVKSLVTAISEEQSQTRFTKLEYEEIDDEPSFAADFFGSWVGYKGEKEIEIVFNSVHGDTLFGYNIVDQKKRLISGLVIEEADGYIFRLSESGDEEGYGFFILKMSNNIEYEAIGEWKSSNEPITESVGVRLQ